MKVFKYTLIILAIFSEEIIFARIYISEVINNMPYNVSLVYPARYPHIKITNSKSIRTGERGLDKIKLDSNKTSIILPPGTITSLESLFIPNEIDGSVKSGIHVETGTKVEIKGAFAVITQNKNFIELIPVKNGTEQYMNRKHISHEDLIEGERYILEITNADNISVYNWKKEKIESHFNPANLQPQELLNQAIVNNSVEDIKAAIRLGANVNVGIGNQLPLLLAVIMEKELSIQELLERGANPNIQYLNKPLIFSIIKKNNYKLAQIFLKYGINLTDLEKKDIVDYIMSKNPYEITSFVIDTLKMLNYNIQDNFADSDISRNKWYQLLVRHYMGTHSGKPYGHAGLPRVDSILLFLKNGANPNQIFHVAEGGTWFPLLLIVDNYIGLENKRCEPNVMDNLIKSLLDAGADINLKASCFAGKKEASPLSYLLKYDNSNCVIDILVRYKASIDKAVQLFLDDEGIPSKTFRLWQKSGSWNLLSWSVENNNPEAVRLLVNAGFKGPSSDKNEALKLAISKGYSEIISILMSN